MLDEQIEKNKVAELVEADYREIEGHARIGTLNELKMQYRTSTFGGQLSKKVTEALINYGAIALKKTFGMSVRLPMINSEVFRDEHSVVALHHEIIELICGKYSHYFINLKEEYAPLRNILRVVPESYRNMNHYIAVIYQLRLASELGILDEHLQLLESIEQEVVNKGLQPEEKIIAERNFRNEIVTGGFPSELPELPTPSTMHMANRTTQEKGRD